MDTTVNTVSPAIDERVNGALLGCWIGDALAMPVHWYYNRAALFQDYGRVTTFVAPKNPHPDSILWRSHWSAPSPAMDILGDQRRFWGKRGVHYHQNLLAGENTLTVKLAAAAWESVNATQGFYAADFLQRYHRMLLPPTSHRDTYIEECHRGYFTNLAKGLPPEKRAVSEKHISGVAMILPVALYYATQPGEGLLRALERLALTHAGEKMRTASQAILSLLYPVLAGESLRDVIQEECRRQRNPHFGFPFAKWLGSPDEEIIGPRLSTACYVEDAVPAIIYLALKYADCPEEALIANTNLGGDNVHRGSVLGALLGAEHGARAWPEHWKTGLLEPPLAFNP